jgi:hypothetical protein
MGADLQGRAVPSKHSQHASSSGDQALAAASEALTQRGYYVSSADDRLGLLVFSKRRATVLKTNDGWTSTSVIATVCLRGGEGIDGVFLVAAVSQDAMFRASPVLKNRFLLGPTLKSDARRDCRAKKCSLEEVEAKFVKPGGSALSLETVKREGDADVAAYNEILSIVGQSAR